MELSPVYLSIIMYDNILRLGHTVLLVHNIHIRKIIVYKDATTPL